MTGLLILVATAVAMYAIRASFIVTAGRRRLPESWEQALRHARPAVLAALLVTLLMGGDGARGLADPAALAVVAVAGLASLRAGMVTTVAAGLAAVAGLGLLGI